MASSASKITVAVLNISAPTRPSRDSKIAESKLRTSTSSDHAPLPTPPPEGSHLADSGQGQEPEQEQEPEPEPEPEPESEPEHPEPARSDYLSEDHIRTLFSGAPHFFVHKTPKRSIPRATYPWDHELAIKDVSDSVQFAEPAFSAATLHRHLPTLQKASDQDTPHHGYNVDVVEIPNLLSAQGIEPVSKVLRRFTCILLILYALREPLALRIFSSFRNRTTSSPICSSRRLATTIWRR